VDTSFSVLFTHANGGALAGHFGFVTAYQNRIAALNATRSVEVDRFFTTPPDAACSLRVREGDREQTVIVAAADSFAAFLETFARAIERRDFARFTTALLEDARLMDRMRRAAAR
jgi:NDP-hexose-3-ketoreductase